MRASSVFRGFLGVERLVVEGVDQEGDGVVVFRVRVARRDRRRCGVCGKRCKGYDGGDGRRRWRTLDMGTTLTYLEAEAPRVSCRRHGVVVAAVPWARHDSGFTRTFEDQVAWLGTNCSKKAVAELMRVAWRTVGRIIARVASDRGKLRDPLANLRRIGIDEISYRKGRRYLVVVVDHDSGRLVWAANGRDEATVNRFFDELGEERSKLLTQVSSDAASWITSVVARRAPQAVRCMDPYHVVAWATAALDEIRREVWNEARYLGMHRHAADLKRSRWALWKNAEDLTRNQRARLSWVQRTNAPLYRAYLLKEQLRQVFHLPLREAIDLLGEWERWALRSRSLPSWTWPTGWPSTPRRSSRRWSTGCRTRWSNRSTPASA